MRPLDWENMTCPRFTGVNHSFLKALSLHPGPRPQLLDTGGE